jgi:hypothetical protein
MSQATVTIDPATMQHAAQQSPQHPMRQHAPPDDSGLTIPLPSKAIIAANNKTATAVDATGRKITVKRVSAIGFYRLAKLLGSDSKNAGMMDLASLACAVTHIDGLPLGEWTSAANIEDTLRILDFDGLSAAGEALKALNPDETGSEAAKN